MSHEKFTACPNCGKSSPKYSGDNELNIYCCSYGTVYCDYCSGGGLINRPFCPDMHEDREKIGIVPGQQEEKENAPKEKKDAAEDVQDDPEEITERQMITVEAETLEEADEKMKAQIPVGFGVFHREILRDGYSGQITGHGDTVEDAYENAKSKVPEIGVVTRDFGMAERRNSVKVLAIDERDAECIALLHAKAERPTKVASVMLIASAKKGFLGFGRSNPLYKVEIFEQASAHFTYRINAKICAAILPDAELKKMAADLRNVKAEPKEYKVSKTVGRSSPSHDLRIMILKAGSPPSNERWYIEQVLEAIGSPASLLPNGTHIDNITCIPRDKLNDTVYMTGLVVGAGYEPDKCTITPFNDRDGGVGTVIKMCS